MKKQGVKGARDQGPKGLRRRYPWSLEPSSPSSEGMLSLQVAAARLKISSATLRRWCLAGQLEHVRINKWRFFMPARALAPGAEMARMQRKIDRLLDSIKVLQARVDGLNAQADRLGAMVFHRDKDGGG